MIPRRRRQRRPTVVEAAQRGSSSGGSKILYVAKLDELIRTLTSATPKLPKTSPPLIPDFLASDIYIRYWIPGLAAVNTSTENGSLRYRILGICLTKLTT